MIDINQTFQVKLKNGQVHHLNYPNDGQLVLFQNKRQSTTTFYGDGKMKLQTPGVKSMLWLYNLLAQKVDGLEGKKWKEKVQPMVKKTVAGMLWENTVLFEEEVVRKYGPDAVVNDPEFEGIIYYLQVFQFNKYELTVHFLNSPEEKHMLTWDEITANDEVDRKQNKLIQISPNSTKEKIDLYNDLFVKAEGYSQTDINSIPGIHKLEVVANIFREGKEELVETEGN